jgi:hypothetical protein
MESEIAEMLLGAAAGAALPYALSAAADWFKSRCGTHRNGSCAPIR